MKSNSLASLVFFFSVCGLGFSGCTSSPKSPQKRDEVRSIPTSPPAPTLPGRGDEKFNVDYVGLQRSLGMERDVSELGYNEKSFATCDVGFGYPSNRSCRQDVFTLIHFQILCRDSEGTVSTALSREDLMPLHGRKLRWSLHKDQGEMSLDDQGHGQIRMTSLLSPKSQRLKLAVDNDFLYLRAGETRRVVVPKNWCN